MSLKRAFAAINLGVFLLLASCVSSRHWANDAIGGEEIRERMAKAKTGEERQYWETVNQSRSCPVLLIEDSLDREIADCEKKGYKDCNPR